MTVPLFLDTSALRSVSPRGAVTRVLRDLVRKDALAVHLSTIVEREAAGGIADDFKVKVNYAWAPKGHYGKLRKAVERASAASGLVAAGVKEWLDSVRAIRHEPTGDETERVMNAYFAGGVPFGSKRNRKHLPDAFILEGVRSFAESSGAAVQFVVADEELRNAAKQIRGVEVHADLLSLLKRIRVARPASRAEMRRRARQRETVLLRFVEDHLGEALVSYELEAQPFPSDNGEAGVSGYGDIEKVDLDLADAEPIGVSSLLLPFSCVARDCSLDLFVFRGDYQALGDDEIKNYSMADPDWNDHYVHVETDSDLKIEGHLLMEIEVRTDGGRRKLELGEIELAVDDADVTEPERYLPTWKRPRSAR